MTWRRFSVLVRGLNPHTSAFLTTLFGGRDDSPRPGSEPVITDAAAADKAFMDWIAS